MRLTGFGIAFLTIRLSIVAAGEYTIDFDAAPAEQYLDRWVYPFNVTPGTRIQASTFGAVGSEGFDERDGQFLLAVNTAAAGIPAEIPVSQYDIDSLRLILTESVGGYIYDHSYDPYGSYLDANNSLHVADSDAGRPIELYGAGFRNGFEMFGFPDGGTATEAPIFSAASSFGPSDRGTRNVFAADATGRDVSNNIDSLNLGVDGFDPVPFAIGQAFSSGAAVPVGNEVGAGTAFHFDIDVSDPAIRRYVQEGLSAGQLGFIVTSMHSTGLMGAGDPFVNLATANHFAIPAPVFEINVSIRDSLVGDFDGDGSLTTFDIDQLTTAITDGVGDVRYDMNGDLVVNIDDHRYWVEEAFGTYFGDANLDGEFNSSDFVAVFATAEYEDQLAMNSTWATGDWNGDREFNTQDFVLAFQSRGYEQGPRLAVAVPEPSMLLTSNKLACFLFTCVVLSRRLRKKD